ncbi:MAG: preprotein translocase subunit YajC [Waddliaceae bacterium]|jgi:preprotein translocase subunit YajC|nr:preprotein translocase subunit YajC [Waddliaceae bacterium]
MKKTILSLTAFYTFFITSGLYCQEDGTPAKGGGLSQTMIMILVALAFFYLILWRPEQKKRKALEEKRNSLKIGDKVIAVGIVGTVDAINDDTVILKMCDGSKIEVLKAAVNDMYAPGDKNDPNKK